MDFLRRAIFTLSPEVPYAYGKTLERISSWFTQEAGSILEAPLSRRPAVTQQGVRCTGTMQTRRWRNGHLRRKCSGQTIITTEGFP